MRVSISELLDRVKAQIGAKNDADLSRRLGHKQGVISQWRSGKKSPDDDAMADLYRLAGLDPTEALLRKRAALSKGPAREVYERLLRSVAALVLAAMIATATPVQAKNEQAFGSQGLYIMDNIRRIRPHLFRVAYQGFRAIIRALCPPQPSPFYISC